MELTESHEARSQLAHVFSGWLWDERHEGRVKGLLLFFDGMALTLPLARAAEAVRRARGLPVQLAEAGLVRTIDPEQWMSVEAADSIRRTVLDVVDSGLVNALPGGHRVIMSRDVSHVAVSFENADVRRDPALRTFLHELRRTGMFFGWSREYELLFDQRVGRLILALAAQACRQAVTDIDLHPVVFDSVMGETLETALRLKTSSYIATLVAADLAEVGIDFTGVPLADVLDFRREHGAQFRAYARDVRQTALALSLADPRERDQLQELRFQELRDRAEGLRTVRRGFVRPVASAFISLVGAAWTVKQGDPIGALLAAASALTGLPGGHQPAQAAAYSYLITARARLG